MSKQMTQTRTRRLIQAALGMLIVFSLIVSVVPQNAQAYSQCKTWYIVKEGDSTPKISHMYGLKWREIARANNLRVPTKLTIGQRLCIFTEGTIVNYLTSPTSPEVSVLSRGNLIWVTAAGFKEKNKFYVKVRDITRAAGDWHKIGNLKVNKWSIAHGTYGLPQELRGSIYLQVCLKNVGTNKLTCQIVRHRYH